MMKNLKMNNLISAKIEKKSMELIYGGEESGCANCCICGCNGPSSNSDNGNANRKQGKFTSAGGTLYGECD